MRTSLLPVLLALLLVSACSREPVSLATAAPEASSAAATGAPAVMPCTVYHIPATPEVLASPFEGSGHAAGPQDAAVTIVVFSGYQCPACAYQASILRSIRSLHADSVRFVFFSVLRPENDKDETAVRLVEAAALQDRFWELHDLLFDNYAVWSGMTPEALLDWAVAGSAALGLDPARLRADASGAEVEQRLAQVRSVSESLQAYPLPILYLNSNAPYTGLADLASLDTVVRMEILTARMFSRCPDWLIDPVRQYIATLETDRGEVVIQLFPDKSPLAVNNFVFLARQGWYDNITWHQVIAGSLVASGDPSGSGLGNPGYYFDVELAPGLSFDRPGMLAMDNRGIGTNGSQFFITLSAQPQLDGNYTIFGQVLQGVDVLAALTPREAQPGLYLVPGDRLIRVRIEER
jgi:cyclophilin family peptidyl-prolyl cis-trans isomerase/protein-disulfide isomerase